MQLYFQTLNQNVNFTYGILIVDLLLPLVVLEGLSDGLLYLDLGLLAVHTDPAHTHALALEHRLTAP